MAREKEIKIRLTSLSLDEFINRIKVHGFTLIEEIETKFPLDNKVINEIFTKIEIKTNDIEFKSGEDLITFLNQHDYLDEQHMPKTRQVFKNGNNEIVIVNVDNVRVIIELECEKDETLVLVQTFLKPNEWEISLEGTSYMWLTKMKGLYSHNNHVKQFDQSHLGMFGNMKK